MQTDIRPSQKEKDDTNEALQKNDSIKDAKISDMGKTTKSEPKPPQESHDEESQDEESQDESEDDESDDHTDWSSSSWAEPLDGLRPEEISDDSPSRREWLRQKSEDDEQNEWLDQLMSMVGLEEIKAHFLAVKFRIKACNNDKSGYGRLRLHLVLHGKDGVGKRTIAKLYAQFLLSLGAVEEERFSKRSEQQECEGGRRRATIIFYDKASSIETPEKLAEVINNHENAVLIFSARASSLISLMENNEECLKKLHAPFRIRDYNNDELMRLLVRVMKKRDISVDGEFSDTGLQVIVRRTARVRSSLTFTNIHALEAQLDMVCKRRASRLQGENNQWLRNCLGEQAVSLDQRDVVLTAQDIIGPEPKDIRIDNKFWGILQKLIGLDKVKSECGSLLNHARFNHSRRMRGLEPMKVNLNRVILGPPGVGKTTIARLVGQIIASLGLVSSKKLMIKNAGHLMSVNEGYTRAMTSKLLREAQGQVLIIDDAHMLYSGGRNGHNITTPNQVAAVDALVAEISTEPSEDRCVLLVGYDYRMEELFNNSNPGLKRRFPPEAALRLESYSKEELREILKLKLDIYGLDMTKDTATVAHDVLDRMRMSPKFENAGAVETLVNLAKLRLHSRLKETCSYESAITTTTLQPVDFDPEWDRALRADDSRASLFKDFVGFKKIITQFEGYQNLVAGMRRGDIDPRPFVPWNFVFTGPPGTGKTSTARKVGRLYYDMALTPTADVVTCSVTDVVGQYLGETGPKVLSVLEKGLGKVLFIDEAYRLASGVVGRGGSNFQKEAVDELVDAMTKPRYAGNMVIILAGYTAEMERLLRTNPGLRSRFSTHVAFPPLDPHSCLLHLKNQIRKLNIDLVDFEDPGEENKKKVHRLFEKLGKTRGWANARDIESLARTIINSVYMQQGRMGEEADLSALSINTLELIKFLQDMLRERIAVPDIESEI